MKISIKSLKEFAKKFDLSHVVVYAFDKDGKNHHVATYGDTVDHCSQAADAGNKLKKVLGWDKHLNTQPSRVKKLQNELEKLNIQKNDIIDELKKHELGIKNGLNLHIHECEECPTEEDDCMECQECDREGCNCFSHPIANLCLYIQSLIKGSE